MIINHTLKSSLSQSYQLTNHIHQMSKYSLGWKIKLNPHCALIWKRRSFPKLSLMLGLRFYIAISLRESFSHFLFQKHFNFNQFSQRIIFTSFTMKAFSDLFCFKINSTLPFKENFLPLPSKIFHPFSCMSISKDIYSLTS